MMVFLEESKWESYYLQYTEVWGSKQAPDIFGKPRNYKQMLQIRVLMSCTYHFINL